MSDQMTLTGFFGRIGNFFRRGGRDVQFTHTPRAALPDTVTAEIDDSPETTEEPRTTFLRPWVKRDQAIDQLQNGIATLSDLMGTVRETLEKNSNRQDELANYFSRLPDAINALPESSRMQGEALKAIKVGIDQQNTQQNKLADVLDRMDRDGNDRIRVQGDALKAIHVGIEQQNTHQNKLAHVLEKMDRASNEHTQVQGQALKAIQVGIEQQNTQQNKLANVLEKIDRASNEHSQVHGQALKAIQIGIEQQNAQQNKLANVLERMDRDCNESIRTLDIVRERIDSISMHEEAIGQSLQSVGIALKSVSATSEASARVLESVQQNICNRDNQLERIIRRQNTRFTTMLAVAIVMSMAALTSVVVFGYLGYEALSHMAK